VPEPFFSRRRHRRSGQAGRPRATDMIPPRSWMIFPASHLPLMIISALEEVACQQDVCLGAKEVGPRSGGAVGRRTGCEAVRTVTVPVAKAPIGTRFGRSGGSKHRPGPQPTNRRSRHHGQSQHGSGRGPGRHPMILTIATAHSLMMPRQTTSTWLFPPVSAATKPPDIPRYPGVMTLTCADEVAARGG
jgi:hypothetical protein